MKKVIVVLGGGGVKGLAHIGAWKAIEEAGYDVAEIIGTSIGALVGACIGGGRGWSFLVRQALALGKSDIVAINRWALSVNGIKQMSIFTDEPYLNYIREVLPVERFADLRIPVAMNAVDLESGQMEWFGAGGIDTVPLADAVYASSALPVFYPPANIGGRYFVDGGVGDVMPITRAAERGADLIIAIDAGSGEVKDPLDTVSKGMVAIHHRVYGIMAHERRRRTWEEWAGPPVIHVRPRLDDYSTFDFDNMKYFLEEGYRATRRALADYVPRAASAG